MFPRENLVLHTLDMNACVELGTARVEREGKRDSGIKWSHSDKLMAGGMKRRKALSSLEMYISITWGV